MYFLGYVYPFFGCFFSLAISYLTCIESELSENERSDFELFDSVISLDFDNMPPRLNKRQLRELQELEELEKSKAATTSSLPTYDDIESEEESEEEVQPTTKPAGGFGAVGSSFTMIWLLSLTVGVFAARSR